MRGKYVFTFLSSLFSFARRTNTAEEPVWGWCRATETRKQLDMRPAGWSPLLAQTGSHIQRHTQEFNALEEVPSAETPWPLQLMLVCAVDKGGGWYKDQEM